MESYNARLVRLLERASQNPAGVDGADWRTLLDRARYSGPLDLPESDWPYNGFDDLDYNDPVFIHRIALAHHILTGDYSAALALLRPDA